MRHLRGVVVRASDEEPVAGVRLECRGPGDKTIAGCSVVITGASGAFDLSLNDPPKGKKRAPQPKSICVLDRSDALLAEIQLTGGAKSTPDHSLNLVVDDRVLATADLLRAVDKRPLLRPSALALLRATAAEAAESRGDGDAVVSVVEGVVATLPPLATHPTIVGLATDVLRGRADAYTKFERELAVLDKWNDRVFGPNVVLPRDVAAGLLEPDDRSLPDHSDFDHRSGPIDLHALYTVVGAAMRVGGGDPVRILANVGVIARQLCPLTEAVHLHALAVEPHLGLENHLDGFVDGARMLDEGDWGGGAGPDDNPRWLRGPAVPGRPTRIPGCPDGNPWPPISPFGERPTLSLPAPGLADMCPDWIRSFRVFDRARTYEITSIEPRDACVGEQVIIRGTGLQFEETRTIVTFAGQAAGSRVEARVVGQPTDTAITVEVPAGATCGPVELLSEDSTVELCGDSFELFRGPRRPYRFAGGLPTFAGPIRVEGRSAGSDGVLARCVQADGPLLVAWESCGMVTDVEVQAARDGTFVWSTATRSDIREVRFPVPHRPTEAVYIVTVRLRGRCGTAEATVSVPTRGPLPAADLDVEFADDNFENFHRNQRRPDILSYTPPSLDHLRTAVIVAERLRSRLGVTGSRCSYTNCVVPRGTDRMIRMDNLQRWLNLDTADFNGGPTTPSWRDRSPTHVPLVSDYVPDTRAALETVLRTNIESVLADSSWDAYASVSEVPPIEQRLVYVEAGMLVEELNALLDHHEPPLALATMGAGSHQTLAGAISTGTHSSTWRLPPLGDFVRAIHLVGTNGEQWWLEPEAHAITDTNAMRAAALGGALGLKPCTRIRYSDTLFDAALVSAGCAGITYAYVIETVPRHRMRSRVSEMTWDEARNHIRDELASAPPRTWYLEVITAPSRDAVVAEKWLTIEELTSPPRDDSSVVEEVATAGALVAAISTALSVAAAAVAVEVAEAVATLAFLAAQFWVRFWDSDYYEEVEAAAERIAILGDFVEALADGVAILASHADDEEIADALPNFVELLWQITPLGVTAGQAAIDEIQRLQTLDFKRVPPVAKSFTALTGQPDGPPAATPRHHRYNPTQRIMRSSEYAFGLEAGLSFVDDLLDEVEELREGDDPFMLSINVRFTARTRALIGMQQFSPISCHVELFTMEGLDGNAALDDVVDRLVRLHNGVPHWGQLHPQDLDFEGLFGWKLQSWRGAIRTLADGRSTFRHAFATDRGLLE